MKKKIMAVFVACAMVLSLAVGIVSADEGDKVYTVSIQFTFPEESATGAKKVLSEIEEESNGRIKFETYYSYAYVEQADVPEGLETGQLDIAGFMPVEHAGKFPLNGTLISLPLYNYPDWNAASQIYLSALYNSEDMLAEFTNHGMVFWAGYICPGFQILSTKELNSKTPDLFSGLTVMCDQAEVSQLVNVNSGGAINAFPPDYLTNLQNGVADTLIQHVNCAFVFGCFDYVKSAVFFGESGLYNLPCVYAFSQSFWDSLPEDLQAIFIAHASEMCYESHASDYALYANAAYPALEEAADIVVLNDEEIAVWQDAISGVVDASMEKITKDSAAAPEVYGAIKQMIADYDADTFEIGTNNFGETAVWQTAE
ncbi:MAG: hypothetical protein HUJ76_08855 [Parasporobacterium sp.]|nr:hypothetical protein [Parasporobacterium sp.]